MPKQRSQDIAAGAGFTNIVATICLHYLKVYENGDRTKALDYQTPDDAFTTTFTTKAGDVIERIGHGRSGMLGRPAGFTAYQDPATGDTILKVRTNDASGTTVTIIESENEL